MNIPDLLDQIRETRSESAFEALMGHFTNLVYSVAHRRLRDTFLAEECTQEVFIRLVRIVSKLRTEAELVGWLHATAHRIAIDRWRAETRRQTREEKVASMSESDPAPSLHWNDLAPLLDQALNQLNQIDRQAILLRYFQCESIRAVGSALGLTEDAAKMRLRRALEKLHLILGRRGITCSVAVLAAMLEQNAVEAALPSLLVKLKAARIASRSMTAPAGFSMFTTGIFLMKSKILALIILGLLAYWGWRQAGPAFRGQRGSQKTAATLLARPPAGKDARPRGSGLFKGLPGDSASERLALLREVIQGARRVKAYPPQSLWEALKACADLPSEAEKVLEESLSSSDYEIRHWAVAGLEMICQDGQFRAAQGQARVALARVAVSPVQPDELRNQALLWAFPSKFSIDAAPVPPEPVSPEVLAVLTASFQAKGIEMANQNMIVAEKLNQRLLASGQNFDSYRTEMARLVTAGDSDQRLAAAYAMSGLPGEMPAGVKGALLQAIQEDSPRSPTAMAAKALGRLGASAQDAIPALIEYRDKHRDLEYVREIVEQAIVSIQPDLASQFPARSKGPVQETPNLPQASSSSVRRIILDPLLAELRDPDRRQKFVLEDHWWQTPLYLVGPLQDAFHQAAEQSDTETAALLEQLAERITPLLSAEEEVPLERDLPDVGELLGRAEGVTLVPENGIPAGAADKVRGLATKYGPGIFGPPRTTPAILRQAAADLRQINGNLYQAALKSFLEYHPELDRIFR